MARAERPPSLRRRRVGIGLLFLLVAALVAFALSRLNLARVGHELVTASPGWIVAALAVMASSLVLRSISWHQVLGAALPHTRIPWAPVTRATMIGVMGSAVFPGRLGEPSRVLVVSRGSHGYGGPCPSPPSGVRVICFDPNPADTRGEAEYMARLAQRNGWNSIVVVATPEQATRARLLVSRCYPGAVYVIAAPVPRSQLPYQVIYGWGALIKAVTVQRAC